MSVAVKSTPPRPWHPLRAVPSPGAASTRAPFREHIQLVKPNFAFQKRQKELDKKRKAEEKLRAKQARKQGGATQDGAAPEEGAVPEEGGAAADPAAPPDPAP